MERGAREPGHRIAALHGGAWRVRGLLLSHAAGAVPAARPAGHRATVSAAVARVGAPVPRLYFLLPRVPDRFDGAHVLRLVPVCVRRDAGPAPLVLVCGDSGGGHG